MATQDMVDYHTEILSSVLTKPTDEDDDDSDPLVVMEFFKLHGSMTQKERIEIFKTFRQAKSGILLCTVSNALYEITKSRYFQSFLIYTYIKIHTHTYIYVTKTR